MLTTPAAGSSTALIERRLTNRRRPSAQLAKPAREAEQRSATRPARRSCDRLTAHAALTHAEGGMRRTVVLALVARPGSFIVSRARRRIFDALPVAAMLLDSGVLRAANRACCKLFDLPDDEMLQARRLCGLLRAVDAEALDQRLQTNDAISIAPDRPPALAAEIQRRDGQRCNVWLDVAPWPREWDSTEPPLPEALPMPHRATAPDPARVRESRVVVHAANRAIAARDDERRRIAQELHDDLGQRLAVLKMDLAAWAERPVPAARAAWPDLLRTVDGSIAAVRRIAADLRPPAGRARGVAGGAGPPLAADLRPPAFDALDLPAAVDALADAMLRRHGVATQVQFERFDPPLDHEHLHALYRIIQESLTNVARHAGAKAVRIVLKPAHEHAELSIEDDGCGMPPPQAGQRGFGLIGMRERAFLLGGAMHIATPATGGTRITVHLPQLCCGNLPRC